MTADAATTKRSSSRSGFSGYLRTHAIQIGITVVALLIWAVFAIGSPETFFSYNIYQAFMSTTPFFAIMALPLTMVMITGEMDLSFPSIMSFGMLIFASLLLMTGNMWISLVGCLVAGLLAGTLNGWITVAFGVPSLVVTIGTQFFWRGVVQVATDGRGTSLLSTRGTFFYELLVGRLFGLIPMQMVWTVLIAIGTWVILNRTSYGAHVYLIGDNEESARLMGINVGRRKMLVFGITGLAAAFAGLDRLARGHLLLADPGRRLPAQYPVLGLPGRHFGLWRRRHDLRHLCGLVHHRRHQRRHRGDRPVGLLDAADLRLDHRAVGRDPDGCGQAARLSTFLRFR